MDQAYVNNNTDIIENVTMHKCDENEFIHNPVNMVEDNKPLYNTKRDVSDYQTRFY